MLEIQLYDQASIKGVVEMSSHCSVQDAMTDVSDNTSIAALEFQCPFHNRLSLLMASIIVCD